ncbi:hypothetical protein B0E53_06863 [Micromonospora sp. MH33]|nr:hypothetical protein B0E53_06863 [Micromonospora sp. MH33]
MRPDERRRQAAVLPQAGDRRPARHEAQAADRRGAGPGAARHRVDELPLPRRRTVSRGPLGPCGRRPGRAHRVPRRPGLGRGVALRPRPEHARQELHPGGRLPRRCRRLRPVPVRHLAPRGTRHGPAAAPAAGDLLGGDRAGRHRPALAARQPDRRLRRGDHVQLRDGPAARARGRRHVPRHRQHHQRRIRPDLVHPRPQRPRRHRRHRLLVVAGSPAPGRARAAPPRVRPGHRRRRHGDGHPGRLRRLLPAARHVRRRAVQGVRGRRRRHRLGRGRGRNRGRAARRRRAQRPPDPRRDPRQRPQPGRRVQRPHRPERPLPAAGDPGGPGQRPARRRRRRPGRGARHRHHPGRPDRGAGPARHVRPGPPRRPAALAGLGEVEHRPHAECRRGRRPGQDGDGAAARRTAGDPARRRAVPARRLVRRGGRADHREPALA